MAHKVKNTSEVQYVTEYTDGDTRTLKIANPRNDLTESDFEPIATAAAGVLIGDKNGAEFSQISSATIINKAITTLDLNVA